MQTHTTDGPPWSGGCGHHQLHHFASHLRQWGWVPSCFSLERKHKGVKKFGNPMMQVKAWDTTVLRECTVAHFENLKNPELFSDQPGLLTKSAPTAALRRSLERMLCLTDPLVAQQAQICVCRAARASVWDKCSVGDVVLYLF